MRDDILGNVRPGGILARGPKLAPVQVHWDVENEEGLVFVAGLVGVDGVASRGFSDVSKMLDYASKLQREQNRGVEYYVMEPVLTEESEFLDRFAPAEEEDALCFYCSGSGEGQTEYSRCYACKGSGVLKCEN